MTDVPISACLTFNKNLWIWPKFRTFHVIYKIRPDGNFGSEKEDMSGKIRTYGSPSPDTHLRTNIISSNMYMCAEYIYACTNHSQTDACFSH